MNKNDYMISIDDLKTVRHGAVRRGTDENVKVLSDEFGSSPDFIVRNVYVQGKKYALVYFDSICESKQAAETVLKPIFNYKGEIPEKNTADFILSQVVVNTDSKIQQNLDEVIRLILLGNVAMFIDTEKICLIFGIQKIPQRAIEQPDTEVQEFGSKEGFNGNLRTNIALLRKRMTTIDFKIETLTIGKTSNTRIALCYVNQKVEKSLVDEVKNRLNAIEIDVLLDSLCLSYYLDKKQKSLFTMVGKTERPDVLCGKINEGKIGIIVDGSPFVLIVPYNFIENFQVLDDYLNRPAFSSFLRILRILCFILSTTLPALYVAIGLFHHELFPDYMLFNIVISESNTMFPLMTEALIIIFIYEIVREAGLRMPKSIGQAVSLVGAIVIGEAAVSAGLIGAPMLIIVAITAICSFVVTELYQTVSILRFSFIILGGTMGLYGITIGLGALIMNIFSIEQYGVAYLSPLIPYNKTLFRDTFLRTQKALTSKYLFTVGKQKKVKKR
ncbi:MAG: Spore germination protein B1 [Firmicutes bacterium ADurb.Bin300]|nr:MAG: Spore germination protein B1 [Firmicutes bacterium ADurb.Bin300]HOD01778.1 spore germination protein [Clostridiales bacterium]